MYYTKQSYYDRFSCLAASCPESCCKGWQIMIDESSLEKYRLLSKKDERAERGIDWEEGCFKQEEKRCCLLDADELCHLQRCYGEDMLCETCSRYPRHMEEFENVREYSISLSCPKAARDMLTDSKPMEFSSWEDDAYEEYEDFDLLLYEKLADARESLFQITQNRQLSLPARLELLLDAGFQLQTLLDENRIFEMEECLSSLEQKEDVSLSPDDLEKRFFSVLFSLETLHEDWPDILDHCWETLFSKKNTNESIGDFESYVKRHTIAGEQLLMFFLFTYFCGAVYDDWIYSKVCLAVYSVKWIFFIAFSRSTKKDSSEEDILIQTAWQYARETEHSDLNLDHLEEWFMDQF